MSVTKSKNFSYLKGPKGDKGDKGEPGSGITGAIGRITYNPATKVIGFNEAGLATTAYVNNSINNLINGAPLVLDTLNELAVAIGNNPTFVTDLTVRIDGKLALSGGTLTGVLTLHADPVTNLQAATKQYVDQATSSIVTSYNDLTDKPELFTGSYSDLTNKPIIPTSFITSYNDLTNKPTIPSLTGYATESWVQSQGYGSNNFSGSYADLTNKPSIPSDVNQLADIDGLLNSGSGSSTWSGISFDGGDYSTTDSENYSNSEFILAGDDLDGPVAVTAQFSGDYNDLTNKPTLTKGEVGDTGPKGEVGDTGPQGDTGPAGTAGTTGSWTLTPGANTVSFTVDPGFSYAMWVNGNIPNGIVTWTATVTTSNTNVPVVGVQYGWYYTAGNALVLTSIPNQIVGTAGAISTSSSYSGTTSNVFTFGIINNSGSSIVVNWGYTRI